MARIVRRTPPSRSALSRLDFFNYWRQAKESHTDQISLSGSRREASTKASPCVRTRQPRARQPRAGSLLGACGKQDGMRGAELSCPVGIKHANNHKRHGEPSLETRRSLAALWTSRHGLLKQCMASATRGADLEHGWPCVLCCIKALRRVVMVHKSVRGHNMAPLDSTFGERREWERRNLQDKVVDIPLGPWADGRCAGGERNAGDVFDVIHRR